MKRREDSDEPPTNEANTDLPFSPISSPKRLPVVYTSADARKKEQSAAVRMDGSLLIDRRLK